MLVDWFCTQRCRLCFAVFDWTEARPYTVCQDCFSELELRPRIDVISDGDITLSVAYAVDYDAPLVSTMVRRLKFDGDAICAVDLAAWAEPAMMAILREMQAIPHVVPVPLHWTRLWTRGYNQAQCIAHPLCDKLGLPLSPHVLQRARRTKAHARLDKHQRAINIQSAFRAGQAAHPVPPILLIDDVLTTGATLMACAKALRAAGYTNIAALTVARTM